MLLLLGGRWVRRYCARYGRPVGDCRGCPHGWRCPLKYSRLLMVSTSIQVVATAAYAISYPSIEHPSEDAVLGAALILSCLGGIARTVFIDGLGWRLAAGWTTVGVLFSTSTTFIGLNYLRTVPLLIMAFSPLVGLFAQEGWLVLLWAARRYGPTLLDRAAGTGDTTRHDP